MMRPHRNHPHDHTHDLVALGWAAAGFVVFWVLLLALAAV